MALRLSREDAEKLGVAPSKLARPTSGKSKSQKTSTAQERSPLQARLYETLRLLPETREFPWEWEVSRVIPGRRFSVDIAMRLSPTHKLAIEVDGLRHHGLSRDGFYRDREKDDLLGLHDWTVIRVPAGLISKDMPVVVERIASRAQRLQASWVRQRLVNAPDWFLTRWIHVRDRGLPPLPWTATPISQGRSWFSRQHGTMTQGDDAS